MKLPGAFTQTASDFEVGKGQGSTRTVTVFISKLSTTGCELQFLPKIGFADSNDTITICLFCPKVLEECDL